ncbi:hypothetical protein ACSNOI_37000 [Actinomadura kijaniata]|uniref:hypothetical protein n=1 Tax=Actinomadura kijaniata TaxID=46161 RepID=UPI003F1DC28E
MMNFDHRAVRVIRRLIAVALPMAGLLWCAGPANADIPSYPEAVEKLNEVIELSLHFIH